MRTRTAAAFLLAFAAGCTTEPVKETAITREGGRPAAAGGRRALTPWVVDFAPPRATLQELHDAVSPYGSWIEVPIYGEVWKPDPGLVGLDWTPYTRGRWVYTRCGWCWISDFKKWAGRPFISDAGPPRPSPVGCGFPARFGRRRTSPGAKARGCSVGPRCLRATP